MRRLIMLSVLPLCFADSSALGRTGLLEVGILTCSVGAAVDSRKGDASAASGSRHVLCAFRSEQRGSEETYDGIVSAVGAIEEFASVKVLMWSVSVPLGTVLPQDGLLQPYAAEPVPSPGQAPALVGALRSDIVLTTKADGIAGEASRAEPQAQRVFILSLQLFLLATAV